MYRKWRGGVELSRFMGNRQDVSLTVPVRKRFSLGGAWRVHGTQDWMDRDPRRTAGFDFECREREKKLEFGWSGNDLGFTHSRLSSVDRMSGYFALDEDIVQALGNSPEILFRTGSNGYRNALSGRWGELEFEAGASRYLSDHLVRTSGIRMELQIPLKRIVRELDGTVNIHGPRRWEPFLRFSRRSERGDGQSQKDGRFFFGGTGSDIAFHTNAFGLIFKGRKPWFLEVSKHLIHGNASVRNNLITLDPLFLFGTNELRTGFVLEDSRPWGFRIGGRRRLRGGFTVAGQYGLTEVRLTNRQDDEKISMLRMKSETSGSRHDYHYRLHRAEVSLEKSFLRGFLKGTLRLMFPQEIAIPKETVPAASGGTSAGGATGGTGSQKETVRGGWQFQMEHSVPLW